MKLGLPLCLTRPLREQAAAPDVSSHHCRDWHRAGGFSRLLHTAVVLTVDSEAAAPVMPMMMVPEAAVIAVVEDDLVPGIRSRWQRGAGTDGPGHVREIRRADGQGAQRVCMSACEGGGDEAEMKQ